MPPHASSEEIRRAYRTLVRGLHPDRQGAGSAGERALAERRIREVNAAWAVLGDAERRRAYDRSLGNGAQPHAVDVDLDRRRSARPLGDDDEWIDVVPDVGPVWNKVLGVMPWIAIVVVLLGIFVVTAFAVHGGIDQAAPRSPDTAFAVGQCVHIDPGPATSRVPCGSQSGAQIIQYVSRAPDCPPGTAAHRLRRNDLELACLEASP